MTRDGRGNADEEENTGSNEVIPSTALDALSTALTSSITTAAATAVSSIAAAPEASATARKVSTATNLYDTESMYLDLKEGKYHWKMVTAREEGWNPPPPYNG